MAWFDDTADAHLLHASIREHPELDNAIEKAEYDLFQVYTELERDEEDEEELVVKLRGYDDDPEEADEALVEAVKRTIAELVSNRLRAYDQFREIQSQRQGQRSETFFRESPAWDAFSKNWNFRLRVFDMRKKLYFDMIHA